MRILAKAPHLFTLALALSGCVGAGLAQLPGPAPVAPATLRTFADWKTACAKLSSNRSLQGKMPPSRLLPLTRFSEFDEVLTQFFAQCQTGSLAQATNWLDAAPSPNTFLNTGTAYFLPSKTVPSTPAIPFEPFAQKLIVPTNSEIFFRADLHGDIHSLMANLVWLNDQGFLQGFSIARTNFHMIFLGDYTDRGSYGVEVLYTLLRLKLANPEQVFLLRGNHEEVSLQLRYGFVAEGRAKYGASFDAAQVERAYDFFPVVVYAGTWTNFIQCNHGGMEPGFAPGALLDSAAARFQFLGVLEQKKFLTARPEWLADADNDSRRTAAQYLRDFRPTDPMNPIILGFMWNDFTVLADEPQFAFDPQRSFIYGSRATEFLLRRLGTKSNQIHAVFRGHQQASVLNPMMRRLVASRGVFRHWQSADSRALLNASVSKLATVLENAESRAIPPGSVWTFNVAPDSVYGENSSYDFDAFGILKVAQKYSDWRLQVVNVIVKPAK